RGNTLRIEQAAGENAEPVYQPLRYQGQYFGAETGLLYNRFRDYDPDAGRFVSQDPIGLAGGVNL
ncbi:RHS repeat-associated core domain-containing protein, partial [Pantoea sp. MHSD4]